MNPDAYDRLRDSEGDAFYEDDLGERDSEWRETPGYWNGAEPKEATSV